MGGDEPMKAAIPEGAAALTATYQLAGAPTRGLVLGISGGDEPDRQFGERGPVGKAERRRLVSL